MKKTDIKLESKNYIFNLDKKTLAITSLLNKITGDQYLKENCLMPLFYLKGLKKGEMIQLLPSFIRLDNRNSEIVVRVAFKPRNIYANIIVAKKNEEQLVFKIEIENNDEEFRVCETVGPNIYGLSLGEDYKKNILIYPHHAGEKTINPIERYRQDDLRNFWRAKTEETAYGTYRRQINYCGLASMTFMYLYDQMNGLYFGSHDLSYPVTGIVVEVGKDRNYIGFSYTKYFDFSHGETYASGEYIIVINDKDWHSAKEIYRSYLSPHLKFHNYPDYLDNQWGLNQCYNFKRQGGLVQNYFSDIPNMYDYGKKYGLNHMFIASWNRGGFDTCYPEYYPDMDLGSAMDFVRGLEYVKDNGGIPTLYINARIFDLSGNYASTVGEKIAMKKSNDENYIETYGSKSFSVSCPADEKWSQQLIDTAEFLVRGYGTTGVYLDQLGSAEPFPCYQDLHSHKHIGDFNKGYLYILEEIHKKISKHNENNFILTENIGDIYGSYTFGNLTWNGIHFDEYFNIIKYIFPEFIHINMVNPKKGSKDDNYNTEEFYEQMEKAIVLGSILWFAPTIINYNEKDPVIKYAYQALKFRESLQPMIKNSVFKDDVYFTNLPEGIRGSVFESKDGFLIIIGNKDKIDGRITLDICGKIKEAKNFELNDIFDKIEIINDKTIIKVNDNFQYFFLHSNTPKSK